MKDRSIDKVTGHSWSLLSEDLKKIIFNFLTFKDRILSMRLVNKESSQTAAIMIRMQVRTWEELMRRINFARKNQCIIDFQGAVLNFSDCNSSLNTFVPFPGNFQERIRSLLMKSANINDWDSDGTTLLHKVIFADWSESEVKFLVENGANINAKNFYGDTPLHVAIWSLNRIGVKMLLKRGAHIEAVNCKGQTPLFLAKCLDDDIVKVLLENGATR